MRKAANHRRNGQAKRSSEKARYSLRCPSNVVLKETFDAVGKTLADLPASDNAEGAVDRMLHANAILRHLPWPKPFDETVHRLRCGDARDLSWLGSGSVHLVVTSPPYWTLKQYEPNKSQLGAVADYELFLAELDRVWAECARVLV